MYIRYIYTYIYIYIYIYRYAPMEFGTPDPNPRNLVNRCFQYDLVNLAFFEAGYLGL